MSEPIPPEEWDARVQRRAVEPGHVFPARPEVVQVTEADLAQRAAVTESEGYRPSDMPLNPTPNLLRPEQQQRPLWRRPPGQKDDMGEPTAPSG